MKRKWKLKAVGGAFDGFEVEAMLSATPAQVMILWRCGGDCEGHATFNAEAPGIVLATAEAYRRTQLDAEALVAVYEQGEPTGGSQEMRELAGVGGREVPDAYGQFVSRPLERRR